MGVPKYYRWLSERYPLINQAIYDAIRPEFDCMYLDMNGIIHVATHGPAVDTSRPLDDDTAMSCVFQYIDKVVRLGRPNRLLYMCLDGVAPRAKMNQQRQRRFRSAQDSAKTREMAIAAGELNPSAQLFDSNCITPGTTFMAKLTEHLKFFIRKKVQEDPLWRQFTVLFSGHEVPGEAEHKIMRYIRTMKTSKDYDPNTRHLLYGLDADLIFLSLATHEPHFALLREEIVFGKPTKNDGRKSVSNDDAFQLLHISVLRDCLEHEFRGIDIPFGFDLERIIDDWIFISFFIGNDFIPHLPSMDIHHGTLDRLISIYKSLLPKFDTYMTHSGDIDLEKLEVMLHRLSEFELEILELQKKDKEYIESKRSYPGPSRVERLPVGPQNTETKVAGDGAEDSSDSDIDDFNLAVRNLEIEEEDLTTTYYHDKWFGLMDKPGQLDMLCRSYVEGLCWVLQYYYQGVPSWGWFYPYFYAPLASSLRNISRYQINFVLGEPFLPFEQLLGVLPPASAPLIPKPVANLMTDPSSPIIDFYPETFTVDMNGKKNEWEGIALIPFVDESRLVSAIRSLPESSFTPEELQRNQHGDEYTYRYDPAICGSVRSSIPQLFASIDASNCRVERFVLPSTGSARHFARLCKGVKMPAPSFPCLNLLNITMALAHANVDVFGRITKRESLVATIVADPSLPLLQRSQSLIGKQCIVDWPFLRDAIVVSVSDGKLKYSAEYPDGKSLSLKEASNFFDDAVNDRINILTTRAVDIGDQQVRVDVKLFTGMGRSSNGATHKKFAVETIPYPAQLVAETRSVADKRFDTAPAQSIKDAFPLNCPIIYLGTPVELYGCTGTVVNHDSKFSATICLTNFTQRDVQAFRKNLHEMWIPSFKAAQHLNMSPSLLGRISGAVLVNPGRVNLGLNLKLVQRQMMVPGYTRVKFGTTGSWEYTQAALRLIDSYRIEFPELLSAVDDTEQKVVDLREYVDDPKDYITKVKAWLKAQPCSQLPLVPQTSSVLSPDAIAEIERLQSEHSQQLQAPQNVTLRNVPVQLLYKQSQRVQWSPTELQYINLGDCVLFLGGHHGVPFGMKGNVVGIHNNENDVVFDETILSGSDLNGRCSPSRGLTLASKCLLNLSRPRVPPLHPKAPIPEIVLPASNAPLLQAPTLTAPVHPERVVSGFAAERPAARQPHAAKSGPSQPRTRTGAYSARNLGKASSDDDGGREWASMWNKMQNPDTVAKLEESQSASLTFQVPHSKPSSAQHQSLYIRHQPQHKGVPRAPVINKQHHVKIQMQQESERWQRNQQPRTQQESERWQRNQQPRTQQESERWQRNQQPKVQQRGQHPQHQQQQHFRATRHHHDQQQHQEYSQYQRYRSRDTANAESRRQPDFSSHSSMKTLFGLHESPTETARRSLLPAQSPTPQDSEVSVGSDTPMSRSDRASSHTIRDRPFSSAKGFPKSSSQSTTTVSAPRWRKKQPSTDNTLGLDPNFRPFSSYGLVGQNQNQPQPSLVRPEDFQQPRK